MDRDDFLDWAVSHLGGLGHGPATVYSAASARVRSVTLAQTRLGKVLLMVDVMKRPAGQVRCWVEMDETDFQKHMDGLGFWSDLEKRWKAAPLTWPTTPTFEARTPKNPIRGVKLFWAADPNNYRPELPRTTAALEWLTREVKTWAKSKPGCGFSL